MNRASPVELRKAMEVASAYVKAGLLFVPMPVTDESDHKDLIAQADARLEQMAQQQEA